MSPDSPPRSPVQAVRQTMHEVLGATVFVFVGRVMWRFTDQDVTFTTRRADQDVLLAVGEPVFGAVGRAVYQAMWEEAHRDPR